MPTIACIVEGEGDELSVPLLIRRIVAEHDPSLDVQIHVAKRASRDKLITGSGIERAVDEAARAIGPGGAIFVLLDADDDCPATLGPDLLRRARSARRDRRISVVLAKREYEAWFLAAASSLSGRRGLPSNLIPPSAPETIRGAKEWLRAQMPKGRRYRETVDQPAFSATFDLATARAAAPSFDKCCRDILRLITAPHGRGATPTDDGALSL